MRKLIIQFLSISVIVVSSLQCSRTVKQITNVRLCESINEKGCVKDSPSFDNSIQLIHCSFFTENIESSDTMKISWYYLGDSRVLIEETLLIISENKLGSPIISSLNKPLNGWPSGVFEVKISIENEEQTLSVVKSFLIQ